jgi:hypothetical protein
MDLLCARTRTIRIPAPSAQAFRQAEIHRGRCIRPADGT